MTMTIMLLMIMSRATTIISRHQRTGAPEISGGNMWEYAGGYSFGGDFDSGAGMF
jgi:hypothetical protein